MSRIIAYDMCRLFVGPYYATPRGIDRVDMIVANHVFADPDSPHVAVLPTPLGVRVYPARAARRLLDHLRIVWGEDARSENDLQLRDLITGMLSATSARAAPRPGTVTPSRRRNVARFLAMVRQHDISTGHTAVKAVPAGSVYVNLGQQALAIPMFFTWLQKRPDVACAMMLHDTIPLDHPEIVTPSAVAHHARVIRTAAAHADGLIFSTAFAQSSVNTALSALQNDARPNLVRALPVPAAFADAGSCLPELSGTHYFVAVSTIEPRKNFALLLAVWARLVERMRERAPHLVIVGARGLNADRILAPLACSPQLRERVHQVSGLSSPALARLMAGCAAVLSPSFAEGFGLPLLEGIAMGVPTIASDIPSHREIANGSTLLLGTEDRDAWEAAILASPRAGTGQRPPVPTAMTEAAYCADVLAFLGALEPRAVSVAGKAPQTIVRGLLSRVRPSTRP